MKSCFALVWIFIENAVVLSSPTTVDSTCKDPGLWIDGHVDCKYLEEESGYGMHNNPEGFCNKYFDKCCLTCTRLKQNGFTISKPAKSTPTIQHGIHSENTTVTTEGTCTDSGMWIADGLVNCRFLIEPSSTNIHTHAEATCQNQHYFKDCCQTCTKLKLTNYGKPTTQGHTMSSSKSSTIQEKERATEGYTATPSTKTVVIKPINSFSSLLFGNLIEDLFKTVNRAINKG